MLGSPKHNPELARLRSNWTKRQCDRITRSVSIKALRRRFPSISCCWTLPPCVETAVFHAYGFSEDKRRPNLSHETLAGCHRLPDAVPLRRKSCPSSDLPQSFLQRTRGRCHYKSAAMKSIKFFSMDVTSKRLDNEKNTRPNKSAYYYPNEKPLDISKIYP